MGPDVVLAGREEVFVGPDVVLAGQAEVLAGQAEVLAGQEKILVGEEKILLRDKKFYLAVEFVRLREAVFQTVAKVNILSLAGCLHPSPPSMDIAEIAHATPHADI